MQSGVRGFATTRANESQCHAISPRSSMTTRYIKYCCTRSHTHWQAPAQGTDPNGVQLRVRSATSASAPTTVKSRTNSHRGLAIALRATSTQDFVNQPAKAPARSAREASRVNTSFSGHANSETRPISRKVSGGLQLTRKFGLRASRICGYQPTDASACRSNRPRPPESSASVPGDSASSGDIQVTSRASCRGLQDPVTGTT